MLFSIVPCRTILSIFLLLRLFALGYASPLENGTIRWGPCDDIEMESPLPYDCANLTVPLDYTEPSSNATIKLQLLRIPTAKQPSKGSILFNFGGPGAISRTTLIKDSSVLQPSTGGEYDLVTFDVRGTGNTIPFTCGNTSLELQDLAGRVQDIREGVLWANSEVIAKACFEAHRDTGSYIGTAFTARDLMSVVDALGEDGMLRYWGISYGTTLGATVAAMFPQRIDKLVLDGVQNPHEYLHIKPQQLTDTDKEISGIFSTCVEAGPSRCDLARNNSTAKHLEKKLLDLLEAVKSRPLTLGESYVLDYRNLKALMMASLYNPLSWSGYATILDMLFRGQTGDDLVSLIGAWMSVNATGQVNSFKTVDGPYFGIQCGDSIPRTSSLAHLQPAIDSNHKSSKTMGDTWDAQLFPCARWKFNAKERYEGDFHVETKNPILILSNRFDGITPLVSARNVSAGFKNSRILEINGYGHASTANPSVCTIKHNAAYWVNRTLPEEGTVCETDFKPYSNVSWSDVVQLAAGSST